MFRFTSSKLMTENIFRYFTLKERTRLEHTLSDTRQIRQTTEQDSRDLRSLIFRLEDDKKRLAQRIEKLCANERALVLELERLKRHGSSGLSLSKGKMFNRLEEHLHGLEADRDYWRNQVELLQQMMANPGLVGRVGSVNRGTGGRLKCKPPSGQTPTKAVLKSREAPLIKLESQIQELRADRDRLRLEVERLNRTRLTSPSPLTRSRSFNRIQVSTQLNFNELR
ncbi:hypothetical protein PHET_04700 [Paragonimus heterotremus]|uniref:Uncharacterized protein n=1 Tax=Paragonimus heterotremus TaxID=100268 RepID=A0A8J4T9F5_9TREM|nr:hypothetical protein PHET_04700 [Paragonimus heterotremus]